MNEVEIECPASCSLNKCAVTYSVTITRVRNQEIEDFGPFDAGPNGWLRVVDMDHFVIREIRFRSETHQTVVWRNLEIEPVLHGKVLKYKFPRAIMTPKKERGMKTAGFTVTRFSGGVTIRLKST